MKKITAMLAVLLFSLFAVVPALADMGGPVTYEYDAVTVTQTTYYSYDWETDKLTPEGTMPKGEQLHITGMFQNIAGKDYLSVEYNDDYYYIDPSSIAAVDSTVGEDKAEDYDEPFRIKVLNKNGIPIRKGPSEAFEVIGTIPKQTVVECSKGLGKYASQSSFAYVRYKNLSGWVYCYQNSGSSDFGIMSTEGKDTIIVSEKTTLYSEPFDKGRAVRSVPAGAELKFEYYVADPDTSYFCTYMGLKGWVTEKFVENTLVAARLDGIVRFDKSFTCFKLPAAGADTSGTVSGDGRYYDFDYALNSEFRGEDEQSSYWLRINKDGKKVWVDTESVDGGAYMMGTSLCPCTAKQDLVFIETYEDDSPHVELRAGESFLGISSLYDYPSDIYFSSYLVDSRFMRNQISLTEYERNQDDSYDWSDSDETDDDYFTDVFDNSYYLTGKPVKIDAAFMNSIESKSFDYPQPGDETAKEETTVEETEEETEETVEETEALQDTDIEADIMIPEPDGQDTGIKRAVLTAVVIAAGLLVAAVATVSIIKKRKK